MEPTGLLDHIKTEIAAELERSDIAWPKYGTQSIEQLAEQISVRVGNVLAADEHERRQNP